MAMTKKYKKFALHDEGYEIPESREPGDPIREIGFVDINRKVFAKTKLEKIRLKQAKAQEKYDSLRLKK